MKVTKKEAVRRKDEIEKAKRHFTAQVIHCDKMLTDLSYCMNTDKDEVYVPDFIFEL